MSQAPEAADPLIGVTIGNYQVKNKLGEGGMGAVYLAEHPGIGKQVAVKVLLPEHSKRQDIINRFFNEAKTAASLRHPALVEVFDFGFLDSGAGYLVMDFLEGESLSARLRRVAPLPPEIAAEIGRQLCAGVAAAHGKGIVHRDLKPDNVFLVPDPELPTGERVKILDFGIAKLVLPGGSGSKGATSTGMLLGTPLYMAPEQCRGTGQVDHRADVYSIGCILYEMLGGRPPFDFEGVGEILAAHLYQPPRPLQEIDPGIPEALTAVVMRALEKDPGARQQTAAELGGQLQQFLRGGDLQAVMAAPRLSGFGGPSSSGAGAVSGPGSAPGVPVPASASGPPVRAAGAPVPAGVDRPAVLATPRRPPSPGLGTAPTTFSAAASQALPPPAPQARPRGSRVPLLLVPALLAVVGGAYFLVRGRLLPTSAPHESQIETEAAPPLEVKPGPNAVPAAPPPVATAPAAPPATPPAAAEPSAAAAEPSAAAPEAPAAPTAAAPSAEPSAPATGPPTPARPAPKPAPAPKKLASRGAALQAEGLRLRLAGLEDRALLAYRAALADESLPASMRAETEAQVISLSRKFGELEIISTVAGALVSIDGRPAGRTPLRDPLLVRPGKHDISLSLAGYQPSRRSVTVAAGDKEFIRFAPQR